MASTIRRLGKLRTTPPVTGMEEVEERIREYIVDNKLNPGQKIPGEEWFAQQLGVGRPLVREAMRGLEAVGFLEARRGSGRYVGEFNAEAYLRRYTTEMLLSRYTERELLETRCVLEIAMAADATGSLTDEDLEEISELWVQIQEAANRGESSTDADLALHRVLMRRTDNRIIVAMLDAVHALAVRRISKGGHSSEKIAEDLAQHDVIVRAALARDGDAMRTALIAHFETTAKRLGIAQRWRELFAQSNPTTDHDSPTTTVSQLQEQ